MHTPWWDASLIRIVNPSICNELEDFLGSSLKVSTLAPFGRKLAQMPSLKHKRTNVGTKYLVRVKN